MKFLNPEHPKPSQKLDFRQTLSLLQAHCSGFLHQISTSFHHHPKKNPISSSLQTHLQSALSSLGNHAKHALQEASSGIRASGSAAKTPSWARIADKSETVVRRPVRKLGSSHLSIEAIEERLAGVPVYALSNSSEEFVLVSGVRSGKSLGLFCFKREDAEALLDQMKSMDPKMRERSQVVPVALNKVFQLKVDGVAFRLIPEVSQIKNALKVREKIDQPGTDFLGVPVFQSQSLVLRSQNKTYRPVFLRKEDLDKSLLRAANQQGRLNPAIKQGDIQVAVLEEIIEGMQDSSTSSWDDIVFVPPGFDVSTDPSRR